WADHLEGGSGNDTINAGADGDRIAGGTGRDKLTGGTTGDTFVFAKGDSGIRASSADTVTDWSTSDAIDTSTKGTSTNYYEHSVTSSVDTIEEAAAYAEAHATSSAIAHVFLYNGTKDMALS